MSAFTDALKQSGRVSFAERELSFWIVIEDDSVSQAIEAYLPYDFKPGNSWEALKRAWASSPATEAADHALACLARIEHALEN